MNAVRTPPARIVKRADVNAGLAPRHHEPEPALPRPAADRGVTPPARPCAKEARLVHGAPGTAAVEVRCSCGEWTRVELKIGGEHAAEERT